MPSDSRDAQREWVEEIAKWLLLFVGSVAVLFVIISNDRRFYPGTRCHVTTTATVASDRDTKKQLLNARYAKDDLGLQQLFSDGKLLTLGKGTSLLSLETGENGIDWIWHDAPSFFMRRVRILTGEYRGRSVWIDDCFLGLDQRPLH